jgi:hypothetical protein
VSLYWQQVSPTNPSPLLSFFIDFSIITIGIIPYLLHWKKDNKEEGDHATDASELKGPSKASSLGAHITVTEKVIC